MTDWNAIKNKIINAGLDQPLLTSLFVADFAVLLFHRPPFIFSFLMMGGLVGMCMYFGQKLTLFKTSAAPAKAVAASEPKPAVVAEAKPAVAAESKPAESKPAKSAAKPRAKAKT
jgi:hypothetical protein